ncbi:MAG: flagellar motor protein MotB [Burkholderiales bacterium]|jgi:chemotaxis protein MotB|nr:flagellar motor protein MotB [Burkholderiales bacterium]
MSDDSQRPIIVKRVKKAAHGHHGGAWKIAYADFVTAMMAFFLLMWLLGSTTKAQREGIAEYFKAPLKISMSGGSGAGDASSVIKGGGMDLSRKTGQVEKTDTPQKKKTVNLEAARAEQERLERQRLESLKAKLEQLIESNALLKQFKRQLLIDITSEGLRIQIVDEQNRPMFNVGSAVMQPYARQILAEIAKVLNDVPNTISLSGHTDATPYSGGERGYSNWELSADRANAARRELVAGGIAEGKILRVVGLASAVPFDKDNPYNPINRRISIIVMNKRTEEAVRSDGGKLEVAAEQLKEGSDAPPLKP